MLSFDTLLLVQVCTTVLTTALLVASACYRDSPPEMRWWATGNLVISVGLSMTNLGGIPFLVYALLGYSLIALGIALVLRGVRVHCGDTLALSHVLLITLISLLVSAYFSLIEPSVKARVAFSGLYFGVLNWICGYSAGRYSNERGVPIAVAGFGLLGTALVVRGVHLLMQEGPVDLSSSTVLGITMLTIPLAQVCTTVGLILMVMWRYAERLRHLSSIDALTGALNRAGLEDQGGRLALRLQRARRDLAVLMIDVDHFKQINDSFGHAAGDEVLRCLTRLLRQELRPMDVLARIGGEEFVLVLDGVDPAAALRLAERLRARIADESVPCDGAAVAYTVSIGVVASVTAGYDLPTLMAAGDRAMYDAKRSGRNQVCAA
ncbi:GGDEF domain-containing protein [Duganella fentianensis]|uniref:GGDEF domain-containing protein n=1 Tax=Duganella fentianensis TaxID=2692177 RepID=UPI0032B2978F